MAKTIESRDAVVTDILAFAKKYADNNAYKYRKWSSLNKYTHMCPICHPESNSRATKGWNCRGFVAACLYHGGNIKDIKCKCNSLGFINATYKDFTLEKWKSVNGKKWEMITNKGNNLSKSMLKAGDVIFYLNSKGGKVSHVAIYYGNGKIVDSTSSGGISIRVPSTYGKVGFRPLYTKKVTVKEEYSGSLPNLEVKIPGTNNAKKILQMCDKVCYPVGTPQEKWSYKTGTYTTEFKKIFDKYVTEHKKTKANYSDCGMFVSAVVRASGVDSSFIGLHWKEDYKKSKIFDVVHTGPVGSFKLLPGDIVEYKKTTGTQHIVIIYDTAKSLIAEAGRENRFDVIHKSTKYNASNVKKETLRVIRVKETKEKITTQILKKGDSRTEEIKKLQKFLVWYGFNLNIDGIFGEKTHQAACKFQEDCGYIGDGLVGPITIEAMKKVKK